MHPFPKNRSLQDLIDETPDLVRYFRNNPVSPHARNRPSSAPLPAEHTNWREEQRAWRETAILFDQSHHMPELFLKGPDALKLLSHVGINSFENWGPGRAKQFIGCNHKGQIIGESVLHWLAEDHFELISGMQLQDWIQFNAETGGYDVTVTRDLQTAQNPKGPDGRTNFRFGMDGPNAEKIFQEVVEGQAPDIPFFRTAIVKIAGVNVMALRHGMAGHKGVELSGPYAEGQKVRDKILSVGAKYGLKPGGRLAYFSVSSESGWWAYPLPAIYTDPELRAFREWLPDTSWGAQAQLSGSLVCDSVEGYHLTPWETGVSRVMKFDHDFVGRAALEAMVDKPHRKKVTLVWNPDDVAAIQSSIFRPGLPCKYIELPTASYGFPQADAVLDGGGRLIGMAGFAGSTVNEASMVSLAVVEEEHARPGTSVTLVWGEPDGGTSKPQVERHRQYEVRCTVAPAPYASAVRDMKYAGIGRAAA
ncbi:MAG: aminomethyl transferase family protein [Mesorhizobium sp.]|uniref:aminomethyl transferase family protein n=1 Tax=Mesorhizobium sp. TaxID=1871066 RepID=UPI000FE5B3B3|nr:aminomethyl transferase family protein [Mesorhizobium sp.]RWC49745.1 MAG: aminomethyl transferase family protein [Mesorhizobium sp.]